MRATRSLISLLAIALCSAPFAAAQITSVANNQATPAAGLGHDYIKMLNETVTPANGQVSLNIGTSVPPGRGITLPFSFIYNSAGIHHVEYSGANGQGEWWNDTGTALGTGWTNSIPALTAIQGVASYYNASAQPPTTYTCTYISHYFLQDLAGSRHPLHLTLSQRGNGGTGCINVSGGGPNNVLQGGDDFFSASTVAIPDGDIPYLPTPVTATGPDGTVYYFS